VRPELAATELPVSEALTESPLAAEQRLPEALQLARAASEPRPEEPQASLPGAGARAQQEEPAAAAQEEREAEPVAFQ
jgi:hypothetical protein